MWEFSPFDPSLAFLLRICGWHPVLTAFFPGRPAAFGRFQGKTGWAFCELGDWMVPLLHPQPFFRQTLIAWKSLIRVLYNVHKLEQNIAIKFSS